MSNVTHPSHYNKDGRKECWDEMIDIFGVNATVVFDVMNAYKYYYRAGEKGGNPKEQDFGKMRNYMEHARELIGKDRMISQYTNDVYQTMRKIINESEGKS